MTGTPPIACTLTPAELPERLAQMTALGADSLISTQVTGQQALLRFTASAETRERVAALVAAEAKCCSFLTMTLEDQPGSVVLRIEGPDDAEPVLRDLVDAFGPTEDVTA